MKNPSDRKRDTDEPTVPTRPEDKPTLAPTDERTEAGRSAFGSPSAAQAAFPFLAPPEAAGELGRLGGYRILKVLGQGGMGVVFQGEDVQLQRAVAIKAMLPEVARLPAARERFLREARTAAKIEHDNVVPIYQVGEDRGVPFIAMPLLKGASLEEFLRPREHKAKGPALKIGQTVKIAREIARGLAAAHERGLVHRDIKPANLWLDASAGGRVRILDFGLARAVSGEQHLTQTGAVVGTPAYMAPEQGQGQEIDARADLFSLGVVLYRLCTGTLPFRGTDSLSTLMAVLTHEPPPPKDLNPALPAPLSELIVRLLNKDPAQRPASAQEVADKLMAIARQLPAAGEPLRVGKGAPFFTDRWQLATGPCARLALVALALLGGGLALALSGVLGPGSPASHPVADGKGPAGGGDGFVQLFNGRDLTGWKTHPANPGKWEVQDGALVGRGREASHLFTTRGDYEDFHFRIEAKVNQRGNSGQYFRAKFAPGYPPGYEAQINCNHPKDTVRTGSLVPGFRKMTAEERKQMVVNDLLVLPDTWFTQEVIARGNHIVIKVNGKKTVDFVDAQQTFRRGHLALQQHAAFTTPKGFEQETEVHFRKVEVKELPKTRANPNK